MNEKITSRKSVFTGGSARSFLLGVLTLLVSAALLASGHAQGSRNDAPGAVYTMTNAADRNEIVVFDRAADGSLSPAGSYPTGGLGSGGGLGNQGALVLSGNNRWLYAVNAGSDEISVFKVNRDGLQLVDRVPSGGIQPVSLTVFGRLLYVLNAGSNDIAGFWVGPRGRLFPLPGSRQPLSDTMTAPAQIEFSSDGSFLIVTEKATSLIDSFPVDFLGLAGPANSQPSSGMTPFGFAFGKRNLLFVSEAFGGTPNASALSSYVLADDGTLQSVSPSVGSGETAACWVVVTRNGRFAFVSNTGSASISTYGIDFDGQLTLLDPQAANTGAGPIDMALSNSGRFLYVLNVGAGTIGDYRIEIDGRLTPVPGAVGGLPASANGLAAH